jgi:hypothetical protein
MKANLDGIFNQIISKRINRLIGLFGRNSSCPTPNLGFGIKTSY